MGLVNDVTLGEIAYCSYVWLLDPDDREPGYWSLTEKQKKAWEYAAIQAVRYSNGG